MKFRRILMTVTAALLILLCTVAVMAITVGAEETEPSLRIAYCNLSHKDNVYIKYAVKADNAADVKLLVWTDPEQDYVLGTEDDILEPLYTEAIGGVEHLIFDYTKLAARQMTDVVYTRAYTEVDGEVCYSEVNKYSILQYAYNKLGKTATPTEDAKLKQLLTDMLDYGASAQNYADYKTDRLATMDFYQVVLYGGVLGDLSNHGLYLPGDTLALYAPETDGKGGTFAYWTDRNGNKVELNEKGELTVGDVNNYYVPVYLAYTSGLEFDSNGDGTCCLVGLGDCTDEHVIIPEKSPAGDVVTEIDSGVFAGMPITAVTIPGSVTYIGRRAFNNCDSLTDVYFDGSEEQWTEMDIGSGNDALVNARIHFSLVRVFTVTFVDYDGTVLLKTTVVKGGTVSAPAAPVREGYAFVGWSESLENVYADMTVTALYEATIAPTLKVESVSVNHGTATVDVVISLINNPGLASLQFIVDFDERLTLTAIRFNEELGDYVTAPEPFTNHQKITFMSPLKDSYVSGEFAVLTFAVDASALVGDDLAVGLTLVQGNTMDSEFNSVELDTVDGTVTMKG